MFEEDLYILIQTIHLSDAAELMLSSSQPLRLLLRGRIVGNARRRGGEGRDTRCCATILGCTTSPTVDLLVVRSIFRLRNQSHLTNAWVFMLKFTNEIFAGVDVVRGNFIS